jgi:hypothetical protein
VRVFGAPQTVVRVAMAIRVMAHNTVNALCSFYLDRKLRKLLIAPRLAHLVRLLQGSVLKNCVNWYSICTSIHFQAVDRCVTPQNLLPVVFAEPPFT